MIKELNAITPEYMKHRIEEETQQYKQEIERLNNIINKAIEYMKEVLECNYHGGNVTFDDLVHNTEHILRGSDKYE